jgi:hypothetical protein
MAISRTFPSAHLSATGAESCRLLGASQTTALQFVRLIIGYNQLSGHFFRNKTLLSRMPLEPCSRLCVIFPFHDLRYRLSMIVSRNLNDYCTKSPSLQNGVGHRTIPPNGSQNYGVVDGMLAGLIRRLCTAQGRITEEFQECLSCSLRYVVDHSDLYLPISLTDLSDSCSRTTSSQNEAVLTSMALSVPRRRVTQHY